MKNFISERYRLLFLTLLLLWGILSYGQSEKYVPVANMVDFENNLQTFSSQIESIRCQFIQVKKLQYLDADLKSTGNFWFKSPDKVRWEYREPYKYTVIMNEGKLYLISEKNENEIDMRSNAIFEEINALMISAVSGKIFNNPAYQVEAYENSLYYKVILKPVSNSISQMIEHMELFFNKEDYSVNKIKMIEPSSDYSEFSFINQKFNETIPENTFNP